MLSAMRLYFQHRRWTVAEGCEQRAAFPVFNVGAGSSWQTRARARMPIAAL